MDLYFELINCLTEALNLMLHAKLLLLRVIWLHSILLSNQVVQPLLQMGLLRLHDIHLGVLRIKLHFDLG